MGTMQLGHLVFHTSSGNAVAQNQCCSAARGGPAIRFSPAEIWSEWNPKGRVSICVKMVSLLLSWMKAEFTSTEWAPRHGPQRERADIKHIWWKHNLIQEPSETRLRSSYWSPCLLGWFHLIFTVSAHFSCLLIWHPSWLAAEGKECRPTCTSPQRTS